MTDPAQPALRRSSSYGSRVRIPNAIGSLGASARRLSIMVGRASSPSTPHLVRSRSASNIPQRKILPTSPPPMLTRANSAAGIAASPLPRKRKPFIVLKPPANGTRYSDRSFQDARSKRERERENDVEVEEITSHHGESSVVDVSAATATMASTLMTMLPGQRGKSTGVRNTATTTDKALPNKLRAVPLSPSPSKSVVRTRWTSVKAILRATPQGASLRFRWFCWLLALALHVACAVYHVLLALAHDRLPRTELGRLLPEHAPALADLANGSFAISIMASILGVAHAAVALRMIHQTLVTRQLMYYAPNYFSPVRSSQIMPFAASVRALVGASGPESSSPLPATRSVLRKLIRKINWITQELFWARRDLVVLDYSQPSELTFRVTLVLQTIIHGYNAALLCQSVTLTWVHHGYIGCILANACAPLLLTVLRCRQLILWYTHRSVSLCSSVLLDIYGELVLPTILLRSYLTPPDPSSAVTAVSSVWVDTPWVVTMVRGMRFLLSISVTLSAIRVIVHLHLLCSLNALKSLLEAVTSSRPPIPSTERSISLSVPRSPSRSILRVKPGTRQSFLLEVLLLLGGVVILAAHLQSLAQESPLGCVLDLHAWFSTSPFCPLLEFHCESPYLEAGQENSRAAYTMLDTGLNSVNRERVEHLVIRSCAHMVVSTCIRDLPHLTTLEIIDSTISSWPANAALSQATHPELRRFTAVNVTFPASEIPDGLRSSDFPQRLTEFHLIATDLVSLPDTLAQLWSGVTSLWLEASSDLTNVPGVLLRMPALRELSLSGNALETIPPPLIILPRLERLYLNGNPLTQLPSDLSPAPNLRVLSIAWTNVATLPSWISSANDESATLTVAMGNTPYCTDTVVYGASPLPPAVDCTPLALEHLARYPRATKPNLP